MKLKKFYKLRYHFVLGTLMLGLFSFMSLEEMADYWYYYNGQEIHWKPQADVFAFRTKTHTQYAGILDTNIIETSTFRADNPDKINIICFKSGLPSNVTDALKNEIRNDAGFEAEFPAITMVPTAKYSESLWYFANDMVMLTYKTDSIGRAHNSRIAAQYGLQQINNPVGIAGGSYTYIFRFVPSARYASGIDMVRNIYMNESSNLDGAEPNLVKVYLQPPVNTGVQNTSVSVDDRGQLYVVNENESVLRAFYNMNPKAGNNYLRIYDFFGRLLYTKTIEPGNGNLQIPIDAYSPGIYFASLEDSNGKPIYTQKFKKM